MLLVHKIASWILKKRIEQVSYFMRFPYQTQFHHFRQLLHQARDTAWGKQFSYDQIRSYSAYQERVPISKYEDIYPYIQRMMHGEGNVLWPETISWFSKSSGTTNDRSKYIPVSSESLEQCHYRAGQDMLCMYFHNRPDSKMFSGKSMSIGGSHAAYSKNPEVKIGDVSAIIVENLPSFYELMRTPSKEVALMDDWEEKIEAMATETMTKDVTSLAGVPTWTLVLIKRILEKTGSRSHDLREVWPNLEVFIHGGVNFEPYRAQFEHFLPHSDMSYLNCYNASEGFFGVQDDLNRDDMLLMLDYGIFYEFVPVEHMDEDHPKAYTLDEIELGKNYAMIISTNGGLWRYSIGDTITFTSRKPYRFQITGRTKHFINAFGEELMVDNADRALAFACTATKARLKDYTAAPVYFNENQQGRHEWLIEFEQGPNDLARFIKLLDIKLREINSDYDAKRSYDIALIEPLVHVMPPGTFHDWMRSRGKLGGQNKVPRLSNNRKYLEDILEMAPS